MSVCYYKMAINNNSFRSKSEYRYVDAKLMVFYININKLLGIVKGILTDFCEAKVIGYNTTTNKYWCKMYDKNYCRLHVELEILKHNDELSFVNIIPLIGSNILIEEFIINFKESIQLYTTSSFIRSCLEGSRGL